MGGVIARGVEVVVSPKRWARFVGDCGVLFADWCEKCCSS